jgi:peroxiredoxin
LKSFGAEHEVFVKSGVQILGVSTDPVDSHRKFCDSLKLPFPLLSDQGGTASKLYGILITRPNGDQLSGRSLFLIDREGKVRHANPKYDLGQKAQYEALLKEVRALADKPAGDGGEKPAPAEKSK